MIKILIATLLPCITALLITGAWRQERQEELKVQATEFMMENPWILKHTGKPSALEFK